MSVSVSVGEETIQGEEEFALAYLHCAETIADSECWKAIVAQPVAKWSEIKTLANAGTSSRGDALNAITFDRFDDEEATLTVPSCSIRLDGGRNFNKTGPGFFEVAGAFTVEFLFQVPTDYVGKPKLDTIDFANKISRIVREIYNQSETSERLNVERIELLFWGLLDTDDTNGKLIRMAQFLFFYGSSQ